MRIVLLACLLWLPLFSRAEDFPMEGWWIQTRVAHVGDYQLTSLLRLERCPPPKLLDGPAQIPDLELPQPIQEHPEHAWRLTYLRVESESGVDHSRLDRASCLASIHDGMMTCFGAMGESFYRYRVTVDGLTLEPVSKDNAAAVGFLYLFPPEMDGRLLYKPTTATILKTLKQQISQFFHEPTAGHKAAVKKSK